MGAVVKYYGLASGSGGGSEDGDAFRLLQHSLKAHADEFIQVAGEHAHDVVTDLGDGGGSGSSEVHPGDPSIRAAESETGGTTAVEGLFKGVRAVVDGGVGAVSRAVEQRVATAAVGFIELDFRDIEIGDGCGDRLNPTERLSCGDNHLVPTDHGRGADGVKGDSGAAVDGFLGIGEGDGVRCGVDDLGDSSGGVSCIGERVAASILAGAWVIEDGPVAADDALEGVSGSTGDHHVPEVADVVETLAIAGDGSVNRGGLAEVGRGAGRSKLEHASRGEEDPPGRACGGHPPR